MLKEAACCCCTQKLGLVVAAPAVLCCTAKSACRYVTCDGALNARTTEQHSESVVASQHLLLQISESRVLSAHERCKDIHFAVIVAAAFTGCTTAFDTNDSVSAAIAGIRSIECRS